jgi:hypothetical protein
MRLNSGKDNQSKHKKKSPKTQKHMRTANKPQHKNKNKNKNKTEKTRQ